MGLFNRLSKPLNSVIQRIIPVEITDGNRMPGLDIVRSIAILFVLNSHALPQYLPMIRQSKLLHYSVIMEGYFGVEMFFVLSGFLIGKIIIDLFQKSPTFNFKALKGFWIRRWFRTLPNYFLVLIIYILINLLRGGNDFKTYLLYFVFLQNFFSLHIDLFSVSWSLSIEEWFYLLLPLILLLFYFITGKKKMNALILTVLFFLIGTTLLRFFYLQHNPNANWYNIRKLVPFRLDSLMYGVGAAIVFRRQPNRWKQMRGILFITGIVLFGATCLILFNYIYPSGGYIQSIKTFVFSLTSLSIALTFPYLTTISVSNMPTKLFFTWISVISYSLYLVHELVINAIYSAFGYPTSTVNGLLMLCLFFVISFAVSTLQYHFFERPLTSLRDKIRL